jgi:5-methylcytosine-specific restriction endonuclease McrA
MGARSHQTVAAGPGLRRRHGLGDDTVVLEAQAVWPAGTCIRLTATQPIGWLPSSVMGSRGGGEPEGFKACTGCGITKPLDDFYRSKSGRRGVQALCRECRLSREAARRRNVGMPELIRYVDPAGMKTCRRCKVQLPLDAFRPFPRNRDGLSSWCRACGNARQAEQRRARTLTAAAAAEAMRHPAPGMKRCVRCGQVKPLEAFHRYHRSGDGRMAACTDCERDRRGFTARRVEPAPSGFKTCSACGAVRPLTDFYKDPRGPRGVVSRCKPCKLADDAAKRRAMGIPERRRYDDPPGFKTCRACQEQLPVELFSSEPRNADGLRSWCDACTNARTIKWHRDNPAAILRLKTIRRAAETVGLVTERDWRRLVERFGGCCAYCGKHTARLSADHVVPLSRGGRHAIGNLLPACRRCNSSKGSKLLAEWRYLGAAPPSGSWWMANDGDRRQLNLPPAQGQSVPSSGDRTP